MTARLRALPRRDRRSPTPRLRLPGPRARWLAVLALLVLAWPERARADELAEPAAQASVPEIPEAAPEQSQPAEPQLPPRHRFVFGSYGRVVAATNLDGGLGRSTNIIGHGPRVDEETYAELELRREDRLAAGVHSHVVATLAISGPLFHLDGDFADQLAIRNLYAEIDGAMLPGLSIWAGSRMVRGDDIYLLDWWPLDNLNIIGGGAGFRFERLLAFRLHVGIGRPADDPFYSQTRDVVARQGFEPASVSLLDRPRVVTALRAEATPLHTDALGLKFVLYGEAHTVGSGERRLENGDTEGLPRDGGYLIGAQVGLWHNRPATAGPTGPHAERSFVNLFARHARGLAAYGTFDGPADLGSATSSGDAQETLVALSANYERESRRAARRLLPLVSRRPRRVVRRRRAAGGLHQRAPANLLQRLRWVERGHLLSGPRPEQPRRGHGQGAARRDRQARRHPLHQPRRPRHLRPPAVARHLQRVDARRRRPRTLPERGPPRPPVHRTLPRHRRRVVVRQLKLRAMSVPVAHGSRAAAMAQHPRRRSAP